HDLFAELDAGKVIVICWVMPCPACVNPALTTHNIVQTYQSTNPYKVIMYLVDDFANTTCTSLETWQNNTGVPDATPFSNSAINMNDYGGPGMPKIVVIGGPNHTVFYNTDYTVDA